MDDSKIIDLYWNRQENAIAQSQIKYGSYCQSIAHRILNNRSDSEECVNDALLRAWNSIPPHRPAALRTFLGKITRNLALDRLDRLAAAKRGNSPVTLALEELSDCIPGKDSVEDAVDGIVLTEYLNRFLSDLPRDARVIFLQRYWYLRSVREIARDLEVTESKVKMSLKRTRDLLKAKLQEEGIYL